MDNSAEKSGSPVASARCCRSASTSSRSCGALLIVERYPEPALVQLDALGVVGVDVVQLPGGGRDRHHDRAAACLKRHIVRVQRFGAVGGSLLSLVAYVLAEFRRRHGAE